MKNPDWSREELIIALELYFSLDHGQMHARNPKVIETSNILRSLNIHKEIKDPSTFRNVNGVSLKLANFRRFDKNIEGKGMISGGLLEKEIWYEFYKNRDKLNKEADLIRYLYLNPPEGKQSLDEQKSKYTSDFLFQFHRSRETDPVVIKIKKELFLLNNKSLKCEVCEFDPLSFYGQLGNESLEIHYNKELNDMPGIEPISLDDFIIVCSNCHHVLDKNFSFLNSSDLKRIINKDKI